MSENLFKYKSSLQHTPKRYEKTEPRFESPTKPTPIYNLKKSAGLPSSKSGESSEIPRHASSIDELLNDFRKELESIKSMEIFPGTPSTQKPEVNISPNTSFEKPPERDLNRSFKSNVPPRSQLDEMVNQLEALAPQSESDKPFASFLPHTVADTKKESVISADFLRESEQPVKQKSDSDPLAYLQATTSQQNKPFEATKMSVDRYKDLDTFKTDDSSAIIKQLRIENIQLKNEVSKLTAQVSALNVRMSGLESNLDQLFKLIKNEPMK